MSMRILIGSTATVLMALGGVTQVMATSHERPTGCGDIVFVDEITSVFPEASNACLTIVDRDGQQYARFDAEIVRVRGAEVRAKFKRPDGTWTKAYAFRPDPDRRIKIQGKSYRYRDLSAGQPLDIFLATDKFEMVMLDDDTDFASTAVITTVVLYEPEPEPEMPKTAGPLPLVALLGGAFLAIAGGLRLFRRRFGRR
jgi:hypothetical protein